MVGASDGTKKIRSIYEPGGSDYIFPLFNLRFDSMDKLLVANFEDDPVYNGIELQLFDDPEKGKGAALLMYRKADDKLDFYVTPGVTINRKDIEVGAGVGEFVVQDFEYSFDVTDAGLDAQVAIRLHDGTPVVFRIKENRSSRGKGVNMLAPLGVGILHPLYFPVFMMYNIDLVRKGSEVLLKIGDAVRTITPLPIPMPFNMKRVVFARYCTDPMITLINQASKGELPKLRPEGNRAQYGGLTYHVFENEGQHEIESVFSDNGKHTAEMGFFPPFPNIGAMRHGSEVNGYFRIGADDDKNLIRGRYHVVRVNDEVRIEMWPTEKWTPRGLLTRITFMFFPPFFRTWPKTYKWQATIKMRRSTEPEMKTKWERTE